MSSLLCGASCEPLTNRQRVTRRVPDPLASLGRAPCRVLNAPVIFARCATTSNAPSFFARVAPAGASVRVFGRTRIHRSDCEIAPIKRGDFDCVFLAESVCLAPIGRIQGTRSRRQRLPWLRKLGLR
jgi:hypothetical protein